MRRHRGRRGFPRGASAKLPGAREVVGSAERALAEHVRGLSLTS
ncbi:hypothetical protein [Sorangium sp. So ce128]